MENKIRFRNHFSIVLPNLKGLIWLIILAIFGLIAGDGLVEALFPLVLSVIIVLWQTILWAKTWIMIEGQSIIVECNTFFSKRKNVIGIANISNVNLKQGLLAMLMGTCELKLDTNSLTTADSTDLRIVLKKNEAEALKEFLLQGVMNTEEVLIIDEQVQKVPEKMGVGTLLLHGFFSTRLIYTLLVPLYILAEVVVELDVEIEGLFAQTEEVLVLLVIAIAAWLILVAVFALIKGVVKYWEFKIERVGEELFLQYGLMNKVTYSIPVDKIQAVVLKQGLLARICKQYAVEVVNVGMNDDEQEKQAFLLPYCSKTKLEMYLNQLLPEFADCLEMKPERQPKSVWWLWGVKELVCLIVGAGILAMVGLYAFDWMPLAAGILAFILILIFIMILASYLTEGTFFGDKVLLSVTGMFAKKYCFLKYEKIQHVILKQNIITKKFGIQRGYVGLLASVMNRNQEIPHFREDKIEFLKQKLFEK